MDTCSKNGPPRPRGLAEIKRVFGDIERFVVNSPDGKPRLLPAFEGRYLTMLTLPFPIPLAGNRSRNVTRIRCHRLLAERFKDVFAAIEDREMQGHIKSFGGCFAFRPKRFGHGLSTHSWGIAIDLNPETNRRSTPGDMPKDIVAVFREAGFVWGGDWKGARRDPMHFQYCTGY